MTNSDGAMDDRTDVPEFRSLSPLAALSLVLGLASPLALVAPLLLIVPVGAVLFGLLALAKIGSSDGALTGERLARWSIALGMAAMAATLVRTPVRDALLRRQARAAAVDWIELIAAQRFDDARLLLSTPALQAMLPKQGPSPTEPPKPEELDTIVREKLRIDPVVRQLTKLGTPLTITAAPAAGAWPVFEHPRTLLTEDFTVRAAAKGAEPLRLQLRLVHASFYEDEGRPWRVDHWQPIDAGSTPAAPAASL